MLELQSPHGSRFEVASKPSEERVRYPSFQDQDLGEMRRYYEEHGYVVVRGAIDPTQCDAMRAVFEREVKPFKGFIYRQASASPERHVFTRAGHMLNSILNIHAVDPRRFPEFRRQGIELISSEPMKRLVSALFGQPGKVVQTMYFEGNPSTWAHQDTYYLDSEQIGSMTAAWIALEDIAPGAGRFFVYPGSHKVEMALNRGKLSIADNHHVYKDLVLDTVRDHGLECRAPAMSKGDVLFWSARTIHGSMQTTTPELSRSSVTCHYIPQSHRYLQLQARIKPLALSHANGIDIHTPKDLGKLKNRAVLLVETRFPRAFKALKKAAIKLLTR